MDDDKTKMFDRFKSPQWRIVIAVLLIFLFFYMWGQFFSSRTNELYNISYSQFIEQLNVNNIKSITIKDLLVSGEFIKEINIQLTGQKKTAAVKYFQTFLPSFQGEGLIAKLQEKNVVINVESSEKKGILWQILMGILPWAVIIGVWIFIMRRSQQQIQGGAGGLFSFGASKAKLYDVKKPSVTFKDVAGMENTKQQLKETIEFQDPTKFKRLGAKIPKGVLLVAWDRKNSACTCNSRRGWSPFL